jgi:hypothetical protein
MKGYAQTAIISPLANKTVYAHFAHRPYGSLRHFVFVVENVGACYDLGDRLLFTYG